MHLSKLVRKWLLMPMAARYVLMPARSCQTTPVLNAEELNIEQALRRHVFKLSQDIGERHDALPAALDATRDYISEEFQRSGYEIRRHEFSHPRGTGKNLIVDRLGKNDRLLVIGAHYDTVPGSPGANDNASGIAVLLEIARLLRNVVPAMRVQLAAFDNEEHVGERPEDMGSHHYARCLRDGEQPVAGMWSLETVGYYDRSPGSQKFPPPLDLFYPDRGDFLAFVGNYASRRLVRSSIRAFRQLDAGFPSQGIAAPPSFRDVARSDHQGFWAAGFPALMITDTANFRYRQYHTSDDTIEHIDFLSLARITRLLAEAAANLTLA